MFRLKNGGYLAITSSSLLMKLFLLPTERNNKIPKSKYFDQRFCRKKERKKERTRGIYLREIFRKLLNGYGILEAKLYPTEEKYLFIILSGNSEEL